jgi:hypothetical protein
LQPADMARARARQRAKEISFFIDDITSLFGRFTVGAHCALYSYRVLKETTLPGRQMPSSLPSGLPAKIRQVSHTAS